MDGDGWMGNGVVGGGLGVGVVGGTTVLLQIPS